MEYTGFEFNGKHSSSFNILRVSSGNRYNEILVPNQNDTTVQNVGRHGSLLLSSNYKNRQFSIDIAYDNLSREKVDEMREWLDGLEVYPFRLDEWEEDMYLDVKVTGTPELKFIPFDGENGETIYKGEGSIQFTSYSIWKYKNFLQEKLFLPNDGKGQIPTDIFYDTGYKFDNTNNNIHYTITIDFKILKELDSRQLILGNYSGTKECLNIELGSSENAYQKHLRIYPWGYSDEPLELNKQYTLQVSLSKNNKGKRQCSFILNNIKKSFSVQDGGYGDKTLRLFSDYRTGTTFSVVEGIQIQKIEIKKEGIIDFLIPKSLKITNTISSSFKVNFNKSNIENNYVKVQVDDSIIYIDPNAPQWGNYTMAEWNSKTGIIKVLDDNGIPQGIIPPKNILNSEQYILGNPIGIIKPIDQRKYQLLVDQRRYQLLEWIKGDGNACINTKIKPKYNSTEVYFYGHQDSPRSFFGSTYHRFNITGLFTDDNKKIVNAYYSNSLIKNNVEYDYTQLHLWQLIKKTFKIDDEVIGSSTIGFLVDHKNLLLFARYDETAQQFEDISDGYCYYCIIKEGSETKRYFIPCYDRVLNLAGLYDLINNEFYSNANTEGSFEKGPVFSTLMLSPNIISISGKALYY